MNIDKSKLKRKLKKFMSRNCCDYIKGQIKCTTCHWWKSSCKKELNEFIENIS